MKPILDKILGIAISKKLSVMIIATFLVLNSALDGDQWVNVALIYIGGQTVIDSIMKLRG